MRSGSTGVDRATGRGRLGRFLLATSLGLASVFACARAEAASPFLEVPLREEVEQSPAYRYANMTNEEAFAELDRRGILYSKLGAVVGVRAPIRLTGRLHGVLVRSSLPPEQRASTPFEILDARLALAIDDFAVILAKHDVEELVHYTMYRPNVPVAQGPATPGSTKVESASAEPPKSEPKSEPKPPSAAPGQGSKPDSRRASSNRSGSTAKRRATLDGKGSIAPSKPKPSPPSSKKKAPAHHDADPAVELEHVGCTHDHGDPAGASSSGAATLGAKSARPAKQPQSGSTSSKPASGKPTSGKPASKGGSTAKGPSTPAAPAPTASTPSKDSATRPAASSAGASPGRPAQKLRVNTVLDEKPHGKWAPPGTRHPAGLAIDVGALIKRDGRVLSVASHFRGKIGERTCGLGAPVPESADARELREIVCGAREAGVFTYALTPNYDAPHADHFHLEIKPGVAWFLYH